MHPLLPSQHIACFKIIGLTRQHEDKQRRNTWVSETSDYKSWMCVVCGWIYHEEEGAPDDGIPPGTRWDDVPESWVCPDCGAGKEDFEMVEL